jgi:hypothetical protein
MTAPLIWKRNSGALNPPISAEVPMAYNVHLTFEEALKLRFGLGKLNTYSRRTKAGRRSAANLCLYPHKRRITLNEGKLREPGKAGDDAVGPEGPAAGAVYPGDPVNERLQLPLFSVVDQSEVLGR